MKLSVPDYYRNFKCIGGKCKDSCCIGWGIYIDDRTSDTYKSVSGDFGKRLRENIDFDNEQCFINGEDKRCPFLNEENLCDIILTLGEDKLCEICDRHPRYFEWFNDKIEGGIGLCCEEAARLILFSDGFAISETTAPESLCIDEYDDYDEVFYGFLEEARDNILSLLKNEDIPLETALSSLSEYGKVLQDCVDEYEIASVPPLKICEKDDMDIADDIKLMLLFEPIDERQSEFVGNAVKLLEKNRSGYCISDEYEKQFRNLSAYFIWRYFMKSLFDGEVYSSILLAVFSVRAINALWSCCGKDFGALAETARYYSKITEYSEENLAVIRDNYMYP